ncbi:MAG: hypothetical protein ABW167_20625 [Baekduia sp.]
MARGEGLRVKLDPIEGLSTPGLLDDAGLLFQCPPMDEFSVDVAHSHTDYETLDLQHSRKGVPQLETVSFDTLVVDYGLYVVDDDAPEVEEVSQTLKLICLSGDPFMLTAAHALPPRGFSSWSAALAGPEVQWPATLRSLRITEKAGEGDARYLNVNFVEYRPPVQKRQALGKARPGGRKFPTVARLYADGTARDSNDHVLGKALVDPVTLASLATFFYGDAARGADIQRANGLGNWGRNDALILHPKYRKLKSLTPAKLTIPKPSAPLLTSSSAQATTGTTKLAGVAGFAG